MGGLDNFTMCAGIVLVKQPEDFTEADLRSEFDIHAYGTIYCNQAAFPHLKANGGTIINTASYAAAEGWPGTAAYGAAKAAVVGWSRTCARDWAKHNIRVNSINPLAYTPIVEEQFKKEMSEEQLAEFGAWMMAHLPMQRYGTVDECAGAYVFLASDLSAFCTAQLLAVDGGLTVTR
jgi:NAD(P)-dependent dehydrogenase (short-subunit alcohol dehydrogenase family)